MDLQRIEAENHITRLQLMRKFRHDNLNGLNRKNQNQPQNIYETGECSNFQPSIITTQEQKINPNIWQMWQSTEHCRSQSINPYKQGQNVLWLKPMIKRKKGKFVNK